MDGNKQKDEKKEETEYEKKEKINPSNFLYDLVIIELICYRARANQLINRSNTTGGLKIFLTGLLLFISGFALAR